MQASKKNPTRIAFNDFIYGLVAFLQAQQSRQILLDELRKFLENNRLKIQKAKNSESELATILQNESNEIHSIAKSIADGKNVDIEKLLYTIFDGVLVTKVPPIDKKYDAVVMMTPKKIIAHVWCVTEKEIFDPLEIQIQAERDFGISCSYVETKYSLAPSNKKGTTNTKKILPILKSTNGAAASDVDIGKVNFSRKSDYTLSEDPDKDEIGGLVFEKYSTGIKPNDILKLRHKEQERQFFCRVAKIDVSPLSAVGITKSFSELSTSVLLRPLIEIGPDYKGRPRPANLIGYTIRRPVDSELSDVLHVPGNGLPLGWLDYNDSSKEFYFPLEPKDSIYQSIMIAGVQNKGKSNLVKLLVMALASVPEVE